MTPVLLTALSRPNDVPVVQLSLILFTIAGVLLTIAFLSRSRNSWSKLPDEQ